MLEHTPDVIARINTTLRELARRHPARTLYVGYVATDACDEDGNLIYKRFFGYHARAVIWAVNQVIPGGWTRKILDPTIPLVAVQITGLPAMEEVATPFGDDGLDSHAAPITVATGRAFALYGIGDEGYLQALWVPENDDLSQAVWLDLASEDAEDPIRPEPAIYGKPEPPQVCMPALAEPDGEWDLAAADPNEQARWLYDSFRDDSSKLLAIVNDELHDDGRVEPDTPIYGAVIASLQRILMTLWVGAAAKHFGYTAIPRASTRLNELAVQIAKERLPYQGQDIIHLPELAQSNPQAIAELAVARQQDLAQQAAQARPTAW